MSNVFDPLIGDSYKPANLKPSLAQYDNYQIYNIHCLDRNILVTQTNGITENLPIKQGSFLAVQAYSTTPIECDFNNIVQAYS